MTLLKYSHRWSLHSSGVSYRKPMRSTSPPRRVLTNRGFLLNKPHRHFSLTAYVKVSWGREKPKPKKKKKRDREREERGWGVRSVHDNNYLCPFGFCSFHVMELFSCGCPGNCSGRSEYLLLKEVCDWGPSDTTFCCIEVFDPLSLSSKTNPILLKNG